MLLVARGEVVLVLEHRICATSDIGGAHEARQCLDLLEAIALEADAHGLPDGLVEVDEDVTPQQVIELFLADRVQHAEPLEHADFDMPVVVDVHRVVLTQSGVDRVDDRRHEPALLLLVVRPFGAVVPFVTGTGEQPEHEDQLAVRAPERISLEVDGQIEARRLGQSLEPAALLDRQELGRDMPVRARRLLEPSLHVQRRERPGLQIDGPREDRVLRQLRQCRHSRGLERDGLRPPDLGDVVKVVPRAPLLVADGPERAPLTGLALLATVAGGASTKRSSERCARAKYASKSRGRSDSRGRSRARCACAQARLPARPRCPRCRSTAAGRAQGAPRCARAWCRPPRSRTAQVGSIVDALEEVGMASPAAELERGLVDDRHSGLHRAARARRHVGVAARALDRGNLEPARPRVRSR